MTRNDRSSEAAAPFRIGQFVADRVSDERAASLATRFDHVASKAELSKVQLERRRARVRAERTGNEAERGHPLDSVVEGVFDAVIDVAANVAGGLLDGL